MAKDKPIKNKKEKKISIFGISKKEKEFVIENISLLLTAGVSITESVETVSGETKNKTLQKVLLYIRTEVEDGSPLYKALEKTGLYSDHVIHLIKLGEQSGRLPENLRLVAEEQEKTRSFKSKIRSAMMYPIIVFVLAIFVGTSIAWFLLPQLSQVFSEMRLELPWITQILIDLGDILKQWGYIIIPAIWIGFSFLAYILFINRKTKILGQKILFKTPVAKGLLKYIELARFGYIMGTLLSAGLPIVKSIDFLIESTTMKYYEKFYARMRDSIDSGNSFKKFFDEEKKPDKYIPLSARQMIIAGEKSGNLSEVFKKIGEIYQEKGDLATKNLPTVMEPILLFIVWIAVLFVALAVIMPIYGILGGLE